MIGANTVAIALLTQTSIGPSSRSTASAAASTCVGVGDVGLDRRAPAAELLDFASRHLQRRAAAGDQSDARPRCERVRDAPGRRPRRRRSRRRPRPRRCHHTAATAARISRSPSGRAWRAASAGGRKGVSEPRRCRSATRRICFAPTCTAPPPGDGTPRRARRRRARRTRAQARREGPVRTGDGAHGRVAGAGLATISCVRQLGAVPGQPRAAAPERLSLGHPGCPTSATRALVWAAACDPPRGHP